MKRGALLVVVCLVGCGDVVKKQPDGGGGGDDDAAVDTPMGDAAVDAPPGSPAISAFTPAWGSSAGGTNVKLTGSGFAAGSVTINVGAGTATGVNVVSDTEIRFVTPTGPNAPVAIKITTAGGTAMAGTQFRMLSPLYAADGRGVSGNLYAVNPATGQSTSVGAIGAPVTGLALSLDGTLYGNTTEAAAAGGPKLVKIDPYTGAKTVVGRLATSASVDSGPHDMAFEGNRLLGWKGTTMEEINVLSGQVTQYTASVSGGGCGVAVKTAGTMVYSPKAANAQIYTVNTATGAATAGATMNGPAQLINSLTYVGGTLYGSVASAKGVGQTVALYTIDPTSGALTLKGALPPNIDAIEGIPSQPPIPLVAPVEPPAAAPRQVDVVQAPPSIVERVLGTRSRASLPSLRPRGMRTIVLTGAAGDSYVASLSDPSLAIVPTRNGQLKLVRGDTKVFGPIAAVDYR